MSRLHLTDELLMAYADGESRPDVTAAVEAQMSRDPAIVARVSGFVRSRRLARAAVLAAGMPVVPDALARGVADALAAAGVPRPVAAPDPLPTPQGRPDGRRGDRRPWIPAAMAAAITLVVAGTAGYALGVAGQPTPGGPAVVAELADPAIGPALDQVSSGEERDLGQGRFRAIATFESGDGGLCREFLMTAPAGRTRAVACRQTADWRVTFALAEASGGYQPAGTEAVLDAYLEGSGAGAPLAPDAERQRLASL